MKKTYTSDGINVYFDPEKCIHAAGYVQGLLEIFDTNKRPWINPKTGEVEDIADVVEKCLSGALTYHRSMIKV